MCALIGIASTTPVENGTWLSAGRDAMLHRGPDDSGEWWSPDRRVGLGHRRLAIIDLSPAGHQPMQLGGDGPSIVFNGEIYNYSELRNELELAGFRFRSQSDTEVLLCAYKAWGHSCVSRLTGMFAFAIFDPEKQTVFAARDRAGEKPLFYHHQARTLCFSSELKGLMANPALSRHLDAESLDCYLTFGYVPGERCILEGFNKLPPAHALLFNLRDGALKVWRYWQLPDLNPAAGTADEGELLDEIEGLLEDAVARQLMADVPVGVLLSGGIDSSLITAIAVRKTRRLRTFTIGFPGHGGLDETHHARAIASHFGTDHSELMADNSLLDALPDLIKQFDEPMCDSSMLPTWMVSRLVRSNCVVALGGDGGDELFGGYQHYSRLLWTKRRTSTLPAPIRRAASLYAEYQLPIGKRGRHWALTLSSDLVNGLPPAANLFDRAWRKRLLHRERRHSFIAENVLSSNVPHIPDLLQRVTRSDFSNYLAEDILVKVDRASMLNSLEIRAPFLDHRIIEFAYARVPSHLKATEKDRKILLKKLASKILPAGFDMQRKQGFSIPLASWLRSGPFRDLFRSTLSEPDCFFDPQAVRRVWQSQDQGHNNGERLFALVQFELWRRAYKVAM
jgi:asparagine synthase (glutamine-hydrolysing)